jgi:sensor histidine kinase YesM
MPDGGVEVTVSDTGVGIPALFAAGDAAGDGAASGRAAGAGRSFFGIGLTNVSDRLEQLYGRGDLLRITSAPDEGTVARLLLPAATEPALPGVGSEAPPRP